MIITILSWQQLTIFLIASFECPAAVITRCSASDTQTQIILDNLLQKLVRDKF